MAHESKNRRGNTVWPGGYVVIENNDKQGDLTRMKRSR